MAKKNLKPTENLFENSEFSGFEVEGNEKNNTPVEEVNSSKTEENNNNNELVIPEEFANSSLFVSESEQVKIGLKDSIEVFIDESVPLLDKALKIVIINNDDENTMARNIGKEMTDLKKRVNDEKKKRNKPLDDLIDSNNDKAKKITEPLDLHINRFKNLITGWETEKERLRKLEMEKLEKEKKEREEKEKLDRERVAKIRNEIQRIRDSATTNINNSTTLDAIKTIQANVISWQPKQEFFMEFYDEALTLKKDIQSLIDGRTPMINELEEQRKKTIELEFKNKEAAEKEKKLLDEKLAADKKKAEQDAAMKKAVEDTAEMSARHELMVLTVSLGVKDFEVYLDKIVTKYGNCREAVLKRDAIVQSFNEEQEQARQMANLESNKMKNQRVDYIFEITDASKVPIQFYSIDESKIKKHIQENRSILEKDINAFKIEGVTISSKTQTVLKK